jgi:hypothetical protein
MIRHFSIVDGLHVIRLNERILISISVPPYLINIDLLRINGLAWLNDLELPGYYPLVGEDKNGSLHRQIRRSKDGNEYFKTGSHMDKAYL